jgi:hypothetical protein
MEAMNKNHISNSTSDPISDIRDSSAHRALSFVNDSITKLTSNFDGKSTAPLDHEKIRRNWTTVSAGFSQLKEEVSKLQNSESFSLATLTESIKTARDISKTALPLKKNINSSTPVKSSFQITHYLDLLAKESKTLEMYPAINTTHAFKSDLETLKGKMLENPENLFNEWSSVNKSHFKLVDALKKLDDSQRPAVDLSSTFSEINAVIDNAVKRNPQVFKIPSKTNEFTIPFMLESIMNEIKKASGLVPKRHEPLIKSMALFTASANANSVQAELYCKHIDVLFKEMMKDSDVKIEDLQEVKDNIMVGASSNKVLYEGKPFTRTLERMDLDISLLIKEKVKEMSGPEVDNGPSPG